MNDMNAREKSKPNLGSIWSRIIVKNLPNFLSDTKFREHFSKKGQVTDAKIIKTTDGKSRCFGFIGFRTEQEANEAITYFNNTFIYTSRIAVEHAKPVNDLLLPRPWSAHSVGSSSYQKRHAQNSQKPSQLKSDEEDNVMTKKKSKKSKSQEKLEKSNLSDNVKVDNNNQDDKLHEFLEVMQPRSKSKTWANDDLTILDKKRSTVKIQKDDSDDNLYQDLPKKKKNDGSGHNKKSEKKEMNDTNDMDWFKSKMRRKIDKINDINSNNGITRNEDFENNKDNENNENSENSEIKQNTDIHETHNNNDNDVPSADSIGETGRLFVRNLPYICTEDDLRKQFNKFGPLAEVHLPIDKETKKQKGFAYILYHIPEHAVKAYIELDKSIAHRLNIKKSDILNPESDNMAARLALAETHIIQETKSFFELKKSETVILVKNISFDATKEELEQIFGWYGEINQVKELRNVFKSTPGIKSAKIKMKNDPKNPGKKLSMGFGFVEYDNLKNAKNSLKAMQGYVLDGHALQLKFSNRGLDVVQRKRKEDEAAKKKQESTKIIVKNIAFETTKKELRELFGAYGQIKSLRLPKKFDSTSRGFGFIEFLTKRDARNVMEKLSDTHLLGRHLILEYAENDDKNVEELREKIEREGMEGWEREERLI
ncbi:6357_t:CDS:10 [Diversispora eburnea]|uniref:6357_t:CDS:1 n=1 Tax=Diversispora eburnea TaxID=1213867 RepID=A0A9N9FMZ0_9GLOM|nr:6357_t:CDS:10 [Diversispora eburnea]